jgi:3D (Asp-Asp-Asp) domain-containing protein
VAAVAAALLVPGRASPHAAGCPPAVKPPPERLIVRPRWLSNVLITEYFPAPERWFDGRLVHAPGLPGRHRVDWLYGSRGLAMQGEGIGSDGRLYHFAGPYSLTWRNAGGGYTYPCTQAPGAWSNGRPAWIGRTWLNGSGAVTYPLAGGAWSAGAPARVEQPAAAAQFASGASLRLAYWHDAAVDPRLIPHGSSLFVPAYCGTPSGGWLRASDTGGAIIGPHVDVFRAPPARAWDDRVLRGQRIFVVPPGHARPARLHCS